MSAPARRGFTVEPLFCFAIAASLAYAMWHLWYYSYLPQPFFYDPADLWGDWFNVAYWAYDKGTYDAWGTLYPPISFVYLRLLTLDRCYPITAGGVDGSAGLPARSCDWLGLASAHIVYLIIIALVVASYMKNDRRTAAWRSFGLVAGFPMLEAFEHANLVMSAFIFVVLGFGPLVKSARLRWLAIGIAVNFKVYLVASIFPQLLRRRWLWVEGAVLAVVLVYLATFAMLGRGTPIEIFQNITVFAASQAGQLLDVWFAATYGPLLSLLENPTGPMVPMIGSRNVEMGIVALTVLQRSVQLSIVLAAVAVWLRPEVVSRYRVTNLGVSLAIISAETGGYTPIFVFFFTFMEPWKGFGRKWAIIACYVLGISADIPIAPLPPIFRDTFWPGRAVTIEYSLMLGPLIRPLILLSIPFALSCVTFREVWDDIQRQGWRSRWRFRRDFPVMVGEGAARPPAAA